MKIFLDTSSLFKLYHDEIGSDEIENFFLDQNITNIYLSEITKIEFASTVWKKYRTKEIYFDQAKLTIELFESDFIKFDFIYTDALIIQQANNLINKYGIDGLRTLDSIQLSTCIFLSNLVDIFFTSDKLLKKLLESEGLMTN